MLSAGEEADEHNQTYQADCGRGDCNVRPRFYRAPIAPWAGLCIDRAHHAEQAGHASAHAICPDQRLCFSAALVWIYSQTRVGKLWPIRGLRFGVAVWALATVPLYLTNYVIEPWPGGFVVKILAWELIAALFLGVLTAGLAKSDSDPVALQRP